MDVEREWLDLVANVLATPLTSLPEERLATALMATFDAPGCAFHCRPRPDAVIQRIYPEGLFSAAQRAELLRLSVEEPDCHPLLRYYLRTGDAGPRQVADVPSAFAAPAVRARWAELSRCHGVEHQLAIPLPPRGGGPRWFVLGRSEAFAADRVALARRVQRLIVGLDRQAAVLGPALTHRSGPAAPPDVGAAAAAAHLTPRELAVLALVADGLTAVAAARRLVVAERTIHKHLERVYAKFGVSDRVSAVLCAQRLGILPQEAPAAPAERTAGAAARAGCPGLAVRAAAARP
jgi:DNA-binding CsgD family transcriptional regulator